MILVDSNVIIYAINRSSPKHKRAQEFLLEDLPNLVLSHQNVFEALRVLTHPKFVKRLEVKPAIEAIERIANALLIISPTYETYPLAIELVKRYNLKADKIFDGYLVATMLSHSIDTIATDNEKDFRGFAQIQIVNPFT